MTIREYVVLMLIKSNYLPYIMSVNFLVTQHSNRHNMFYFCDAGLTVYNPAPLVICRSGGTENLRTLETSKISAPSSIITWQQNRWRFYNQTVRD